VLESLDLTGQQVALDTGATAFLLKQLFSAYTRADWAVRLWNGETIRAGVGNCPKFTLVLNHPRALVRLLWLPTSLSLGETYSCGDLDIEGDLVAAMSLGERLLQAPWSLSEWLALGRNLLFVPQGERDSHRRLNRPSLQGSLHSRDRDRDAIKHHYDLSNEFYSLWLDSGMVYSCAYFPTGLEQIEEAQQAKLDIICRKLRLRAGETLLDIGCGWGGSGTE